MKANTMRGRPVTKKRFLQGIGMGYVICLVTHILAALLPMYVVFPFAQNMFGQGHVHGPNCDHGPGFMGLMDHILGDLMILTMIIVPVALLTLAGHKLVTYFKCKCGEVHEEDPCDGCPHRKF